MFREKKIDLIYLYLKKYAKKCCTELLLTYILLGQKVVLRFNTYFIIE